MNDLEKLQKQLKELIEMRKNLSNQLASLNEKIIGLHYIIAYIEKKENDETED